MTSVLPEKDCKVAKLKQKHSVDGNVKEETRSFLSFSRENLSISNSDLEQGFNRHRCRPSRNTIISAAGFLIALLCLGLETWELKCSLANSREIEELKRDIDVLKHRFVEEDLLDELKEFEEQLYADSGNDNEDADDEDDDNGEADIDNADYDSNYEDDVSSSQDYSNDYHTPPTYGSRPSDFPEGSVTTSQVVPTPPDPPTNKELAEILAALRKVEAKRGQDHERKNRDNHKSVERGRSSEEEHKRRATSGHERKNEKNETKSGHDVVRAAIENGGPKANMGGPKQKRSIDEKQETRMLNEQVSRGSSYDRVSKDQSGVRSDESLPRDDTVNDGSSSTERTADTSLASWERRHPPKKYYARSSSENLRARGTRLRDNVSILRSQIVRPRRRSNGGAQVVGGRKSNRKQLPEQDAKGERSLSSVTQSTEDTEKQQKQQPRRGMTRRHARTQPQVYAVHYVADSNLFTHEDNHTGNGRARHSNSVFKAWRPSDWVRDLGMNQYFTLAKNGGLTVHQTGLYFIYAQIHYVDRHDENAFHLLVNGRSILQCMDYSPGNKHKSRSCFSAQVTMLQQGDYLVLKDVESPRFTLFQHDKSFFGLVKLGDARQQQQHESLDQTSSSNVSLFEEPRKKK